MTDLGPMLDQSQIARVRTSDGRMIDIVDYVDKPLYSTIDLQSGFVDQSVNAFTYAPTQRVAASSNINPRRIATEVDTNVSTAGQMASTESMLVYSIRVEAFQLRDTGTPPGNPANWADSLPHGPMPGVTNLQRLAKFTTLRLWVTQQVYAEAGPAYFSPGFGVAGLLTQANTRIPGQYGVPTHQAARCFQIPHFIGGAEQYRVELYKPEGQPNANGAINFVAVNDLGNPPTDDPGAVVQLRIYLEGLYKRPVG